MPEPIDDIVKLSPDVHRVVFENDAIRVLEVSVPPHAVENVGASEVRTLCIELKGAR